MVKRIRAARHYQRDGDPTLLLSRSAMLSVARELKHAFKNLGSMVDVKQTAEALRHGRNPAQTINFHHYREVLRGAFDRLGKLRQAGGALGARKINGVFAAKRKKVRFRKRFIMAGEWGGLATQAQANYRHATNGDNCGACSMYVEHFDGTFGRGGKCTAVEGTIYAADTCDFWFPARPNIDKMLVLKATGDQFNFDSFSPAIQDQIRQAQDELIAQLESDARDAINQIITDAIANDTPLDEVASDIKDMIGLTDRQATAVLNYQRMLMDLDPGALTRGLRNEEYDAVLQDAIDAGTPLSDAAIENMVEDYIDNYLDHRAATIAQTESTRAANLGVHDAYSQAIDRGVLSGDAITRFWQLGDAPCPICESIPDNNPDGVGVDEDFDSDDGPISDPPVHPNCECSVDYVTDVTDIPDDESSDTALEEATNE